MRNGGHPQRKPARNARPRKAAASQHALVHDGHPHVVQLLPVLRERAAHAAPPDGLSCAKCGSTFIVREPAFIHCRYCGSMHRIPAGSMIAQEEFEMRSGLRLAS